ncbi:hypothetical protein CBL_01531 [Carabus blaptoides fortunei]
MKILLIVIITLASNIHCEESEGRSDNYSLEKDNVIKKQYSSLLHQYEFSEDFSTHTCCGHIWSMS